MVGYHAGHKDGGPQRILDDVGKKEEARTQGCPDVLEDADALKDGTRNNDCDCDSGEYSPCEPPVSNLVYDVKREAIVHVPNKKAGNIDKIGNVEE